VADKNNKWPVYSVTWGNFYPSISRHVEVGREIEGLREKMALGAGIEGIKRCEQCKTEYQVNGLEIMRTERRDRAVVFTAWRDLGRYVDLFDGMWRRRFGEFDKVVAECGAGVRID